MATEEILIPDIGNFDSVDIIEVLISVGDTIALDDPLMTVESDKASMDIPAPKAGVIKEIKIKVGGQGQTRESRCPYRERGFTRC